MSVDAYSGGYGVDHEDGVSLPAPLGNYDILEQGGNPQFLRLEANDSNYGNDQVDGVSISQDSIRLHYKGYTYGCISVELDYESKEYSDFMGLIKGTSTSTVSVNSKYQNKLARIFLKNEKITKYGTLQITQSKSIQYRDLYAPKQISNKYIHQRMK